MSEYDKVKVGKLRLKGEKIKYVSLNLLFE